MMDTLKNCPFCAGHPQKDVYPPYTTIACNSCGYGMNRSTENECLNAWNTCTPQPGADVSALVEALEFYADAGSHVVSGNYVMTRAEADKGRIAKFALATYRAQDGGKE